MVKIKPTKRKGAAQAADKKAAGAKKHKRGSESIDLASIPLHPDPGSAATARSSPAGVEEREASPVPKRRHFTRASLKIVKREPSPVLQPRFFMGTPEEEVVKREQSPVLQPRFFMGTPEEEVVKREPSPVLQPRFFMDDAGEVVKREPSPVLQPRFFMGTPEEEVVKREPSPVLQPRFFMGTPEEEEEEEYDNNNDQEEEEEEEDESTRATRLLLDHYSPEIINQHIDQRALKLYPAPSPHLVYVVTHSRTSHNSGPEFLVLGTYRSAADANERALVYTMMRHTCHQSHHHYPDYTVTITRHNGGNDAPQFPFATNAPVRPLLGAPEPAVGGPAHYWFDAHGLLSLWEANGVSWARTCVTRQDVGVAGYDDDEAGRAGRAGGGWSVCCR
ncbi:uncharacterized protein GGS25DRAFT_525350 [Hypoxylon fragiforme]|uniref:uncharacterized protein n=1 Tax=Hypoxylon fragiforme TaxID=63214 RepID=UPI0020C7349A|nr:uncharacterized protein GGS25DRAFT_525350 [Hypoxylon fragiforme]KAI2604070.1 hypothetical protein GGS25DRAFT_525350 [Hypoxylon fragiforme]